MAEVTSEAPAVQESSPRSTILIGSAGASPMTSTLVSSGMNESNMASDVAAPPSKVPAPPKNSEDKNSAASSAPEGKANTPDGGKSNADKGVQEESPPTPSPQDYPPYMQNSSYQTLTPQQGSGYYAGYAPQQTPEPASPATQHRVYDVSSFFQQPQAGAFHPASGGSPFLGGASSGGALSPARGPMPTVTSMGSIPPASPLFPRASSGLDSSGQRGTAPNLPYMSPQLSSYPSVGISSQSSEDGTGAWGGAVDRYENQNSYPSPQMPYGVPLGRNASSRNYSFDGAESLLPPAVMDDQSAYSPYSTSQTSPGGTLFPHQQSWGYGPIPDPYSQTPSSPLQPRPTVGMYPGVQAGGPGGMVGMPRAPMSPYGPYFPASSPGPPIQTTASNKGPDGANLFIFHIPNHFTNLDMYQLFSPYGNLLSVRIMVEKDTGRSRGFGFVSYDAPESAALAIKELNGFPIGNKRLKVQHKQIRRQDLHDRDPLDNYAGGGPPEMDANYQRDFPSTLPPSGPGANQNLWFEQGAPGAGGDDEHHPEVSPDGGAGGDAPTGGDRAPAGTISDDNNNVNHEEDSPLANFDQALHKALPDIAGKGTPVE